MRLSLIFWASRNVTLLCGRFVVSGHFRLPTEAALVMSLKWGLAAINNPETHPMSAQDPIASASQDLDPQETREWLDALSAVIDREGAQYAHQLIENVLEHARQNSVDMP